MSGGGHEEAKGRYRNMMIGRIAKLIGIEETLSLSPDDPVEKIGITIHIPGRGYTKLITMKDGTKEREHVRDPDGYLPLLGIHGNKNELRSFEQLVDYMVENPNPIFNLALNLEASPPQDPDGWSGYVARYPQDENDVSINYIENKKENLLESLIRYHIGRILEEEWTPGSGAGGEKPQQGGRLNIGGDGLSSDSFKELPEDLVGKQHEPTEENNLKAISTTWLAKNSVASPLYDKNTNKFDESLVPYILMGYAYSNRKNEGEMFEDGIISYTEGMGYMGEPSQVEGSKGLPAEKIPSTRGKGQGEDIKFGEFKYECKKSEDKTPNVMFNSTFPKAESNLLYLFAVNVPTRGQIKETLSEIETKFSGKGFDTSATADADGGYIAQWGEMTPEEKRAMSDEWLSKTGGEEDFERYDKVLTVIDDLKKKADEANTDLTVYLKEKKPTIVYEYEDENGDLQSDTYHPESATKLGDLRKKVKRDMLDKTHGKKATAADKEAWKAANPGKKYPRDPVRTQISTMREKNLTVLGKNMRVFIIESKVLRDTLLKNSFPGIYNDDGDVDKDKLIGNIEAKLKEFNLAKKIAEKIQPQVVDSIEGDPRPKGKKKEGEGWSLDWGLLTVRLKVYVEPKGSSSE